MFSNSPRSYDGTWFMLSILPSIFILGLAALAAVLIVKGRPSSPEKVADRLAAARVLAFAVAVQGIHFAEEAATGFHEQFPALFGLPAMSLPIFVAFNVAWLGIWVAAVPGLRSEWSAAFFAAWFLAIAGMLNGIAHPLLAAAVSGYFPGLVTSPFIGIASIWLWRSLRKATWPREVAAESTLSD